MTDHAGASATHTAAMPRVIPQKLYASRCPPSSKACFVIRARYTIKHASLSVCAAFPHPPSHPRYLYRFSTPSLGKPSADQTTEHEWQAVIVSYAYAALVAARSRRTNLCILMTPVVFVVLLVIMQRVVDAAYAGHRYKVSFATAPHCANGQLAGFDAVVAKSCRAWYLAAASTLITAGSVAVRLRVCALLRPGAGGRRRGDLQGRDAGSAVFAGVIHRVLRAAQPQQLRPTVLARVQYRLLRG